MYAPAAAAAAAPACDAAVGAAAAAAASAATAAYTPSPALGRLQVANRTLMLDGAPWMMRGISYSPVPTGEDPGYALPYGDYFTSQYEPLFARDLALMAEMGANTVRVYTWSTSARHGTFLDMAHHLGLAVVAVFEMGTAEQTPLVEPRDLAYAQTRLQAKVRATGGHGERAQCAPRARPQYCARP